MQKLYYMVVKKGFFMLLGLGLRHNNLTPQSLFIGSPPWDELKMINLLVDVKVFSFCCKETLFQEEFQQYQWKSWSTSHR